MENFKLLQNFCVAASEEEIRTIGKVAIYHMFSAADKCKCTTSENVTGKCLADLWAAKKLNRQTALIDLNKIIKAKKEGKLPEKFKKDEEEIKALQTPKKVEKKKPAPKKAATKKPASKKPAAKKTAQKKKAQEKKK